MSGASKTINPHHAWSGNLWLLCLIGLAAIAGGYWLPARLSSQDDAQALQPPNPLPGFSSAGASAPPDENPAMPGAAARSRLAWPSTRPDTWDLYAPLSRLAWATAAVLGLVVVCVWWIRRASAKPGAPQPAVVPLQIAGELALGGRCRLLLVRVGQEQVLLGLDPRGISAFVALPPRFSELLESPDPDATPARRRHGAMLAAMVGEGEERHGL